MNYDECKSCGSLMLPGCGDLCGQCMMPPSFRDGHCWSCGLVVGAGHRSDCYYGRLAPSGADGGGT